MSARTADVIAALEAAYPPRLAEDWDAVGLVCGDPDAPVAEVVVAVDPVPETVRETLDAGAQLLVTHHPLLLRGVHGVPADHSKGRLVHQLVQAGAGLFTAHTNADSADPGVSDALAAALGLTVTGPLQPRSEPLDKIVVFAPVGDTTLKVLDAMADAGAGRIGDYSHCAWSVDGVGQFLPHSGASPAIGRVGELERVSESRLEMVLPRGRRAAVVRAMLGAHPYEEPAYDVIELAELPGSVGLGRIGTLAGAEPLAAFAQRVAAALPATVWGCAPPVTRIVQSGPSRCAAAQATRCWRRRRPPASTPTSPPTSATIQRPSICSPARSPDAPHRRWWTSRTGPRSTRGASRRRR